MDAQDERMHACEDQDVFLRTKSDAWGVGRALTNLPWNLTIGIICAKRGIGSVCGTLGQCSRIGAAPASRTNPNRQHFTDATSAPPALDIRTSGLKSL